MSYIFNLVSSIFTINFLCYYNQTKMKHELVELGRIFLFGDGKFYFVKRFDDNEVVLAKLEEFDQDYPTTMVLSHDLLKKLSFKTVGYANPKT